MIALTALLLIALIAQQYLHHQERKAHRAQVNKLLVRVQTPELAPALAYEDDESESPSWVAPDDDAGYAKAVKERDL